MSETRINSSSQNQKNKRPHQASFNKGAKSSSSIDQGWKIARVDAENMNNTPCGFEGTLDSCESFRVIVEVMAQNTSSGRLQAAGNMFLFIIDGILKIEKTFSDGRVEEKILGPKMTISILKDEIFGITSMGWSQFVKVQSSEFDKSVRLSEPVASMGEVSLTAPSPMVARVAQVEALRSLKSHDVVDQHKRNIAKMIADDRARHQGKAGTRRGPVPVNAAGMPIE